MSDYIDREYLVDHIHACMENDRLMLTATKEEILQMVADVPTAEPKTGRDCTGFVRWLMDEVMDEENWQMNAVANGEIICRKLKKLGMLDVVDGYYVKTQETGEWIEEDEYGDLWVCDQCGFANEYKDNYCPNCGADMRGGKND